MPGCRRDREVTPVAFAVIARDVLHAFHFLKRTLHGLCYRSARRRQTRETFFVPDEKRQAEFVFQQMDVAADAADSQLKNSRLADAAFAAMLRFRKDPELGKNMELAFLAKSNFHIFSCEKT